ncbi:MAG: ABC transporter ATP-binding protein, partial [Lachnospiraceae bacterium]|nr:ABC transporter ATP-binding protein [Lachnospiraceae bacterium]
GLNRYFPLADGTKLHALKNVEIEIPRGKLTILRGRSGSGKTTLLNLLGALDVPEEGHVLFDGNNLSEMTSKERTILRRKNTGFVFQSIALIPMMTAFENVDYALRLSGYKGNRKERVMDCLNAVGLGARAPHFPEEMSGGEQQRVAIARAMAHMPSVIFADEPTGALDTTTGLQVIKLLKELIEKENLTVVMTTHDPNIMKLGDCGYELEDGEIIGNWQSND